MEGEKVLFDASSYILYEASGDSEAGFSDTAAVEAAAAEDDAQSCISGWLNDTAAVHPIHVGGDDSYEKKFDDCNEVVEVEVEVEEGEDGGGGGNIEVEDGVVDQCSGGGGTAEEEEAEDRLFWEACLAS